MNLEFKEKFNNFVRIIENTEKMEFMKQINQYSNNNNKPNITYQNKENCSCEISSGYSSESESQEHQINTQQNLINNTNSNSKKSSINEKIQDKISLNSKYSSREKNKNNKNKDSTNGDELSLLEDDFFIGSNKNINNLNNNTFDVEISKTNNKVSKMNKSIKSEFENLFMVSEKYSMNNKNESSEIKNKLENIYNKIIVKNNNNNDKKVQGYQLENYINTNEIINKKTLDNSIKKISELVEYIFKESIRGWNHEQNVYVVQIDKLKENFEKITHTNILNPIKFGFIYRDFTETKVYLDKDFTKYWIGYDIELKNKSELEQHNSNKLILTKYTIKNKILFYCLKNLTKSSKFKKKISKWNYKFIKKSVQIHGNKKLFIDIILFIGIKNIDE